MLRRSVCSIARKTISQSFNHGIDSRFKHFSSIPEKLVSIDRSNLDNQALVSPEHNNHTIKEPATPLADDLLTLIKYRGPISLHEFMNQALTHKTLGFYQAEEEQIGEGGSFITAPEVSQMFGELIGIWCISMWEAMGKPSIFHLVEMGPGKGTLMNDIIRISNRFPAFQKAMKIHMVEVSHVLRRKQHEKLVGGLKEGDYVLEHQAHNTIIGNVPIHWHSYVSDIPTDAPLLAIGQEFLDVFPVHQFIYSDGGWKEVLVEGNAAVGSLPPTTEEAKEGENNVVAAPAAPKKHSKFDNPNAWTAPSLTNHNLNRVITDSISGNDVNESSTASSRQTIPGVEDKSHLAEAVRNFPVNSEGLVVPPQEILAKMKKTHQKLQQEIEKEEAKDSATGKTSKYINAATGLPIDAWHQYLFRLTLSKGETPAARALLHDSNDQERSSSQKKAQYTEEPSAAVTSAPGNAGVEAYPRSLPSLLVPSAPRQGQSIEVAPLAIATCEELAQRVVAQGGAALLIDYGEDKCQEDTLRAFFKHQQVSVLSQPGAVDITADVDFATIRAVAQRSGAKVPPLLTQGTFLGAMGIVTRLEQLLNRPDMTEEQAKDIISSAQYLCEPAKMGSKFKVLSIVDPKISIVTAFEN